MGTHNWPSRMKLNIFLLLLICICVDIRHGRPKPQLMRPTEPCAQGTLCAGGSGTAGGTALGSVSGIAGTGNLDTGNSLVSQQTLPECKWILDRWNRPVRKRYYMQMFRIQRIDNRF